MWGSFQRKFERRLKNNSSTLNKGQLVEEDAAEFVYLSRCAPYMVADEEDQTHRFWKN